MAQIPYLPLFHSLISPIKTNFPLTEKPSIRSVVLSRRFRIICAFVVSFFVIYKIFLARSAREPDLEIIEQGIIIPGKPHIAETTNWSQFAYVQYATNTAYLCNAVMLFESLHRLGSKADRLMLVPKKFNDGRNPAKHDNLIEKAKSQYGVKVEYITVQRRGLDGTWGDSFTKLLAFNQTQYSRVLSLDSDSTVLQPMDELFLLPSSPVAMPKAYWLPNIEFSSQVILLEPSVTEFSKIQTAVKNVHKDEFDMEVLNNLYGKTASTLPHQIYDMITGEIRSDNHTNFIGGKSEVWDLEKVLSEVKFVHFSDWPMPKPWYNAAADVMQSTQPKCIEGGDRERGGSGEDCRARDAWLGLYEDFRARRKRVCGLDYTKVSFRF